ncbi:MAG TPA: YciI family protein [Trebonia sp.]|nr:YciI family protein [Trebonia sp.]
MQYALLIYSEPGTIESLSPAEQKAVSAEFWSLRDEPGVFGGAGLQPVTTATTVRLADGKPMVTDGPFADTKEVLGGFYLIEAENLDRATEVAARIPMLRLGGSVEIRPYLHAENS